MKKITNLFLMGALLVSAVSPVMAHAEENTVRVVLNGAEMSFPDVQPYVDNHAGRTMVPLRFITEKMGANVNWNGDTQTVHISVTNENIDLPIGKKNVTVNGESRQIDAPAVVVNGRTMVPLRFISENLDSAVTWDNYTDTVVIVTNDHSAEEQAFQETMAEVIKNNVKHLQDKDLKAYMNDLDGTPEIMEHTRVVAQTITDKYDLTYDITNIKVLEHDASTAEVEVTQTTRCLNNDGSFKDNQVTVIHSLKLVNGEWKFVNTEIVSVQYL